MEDDKASGEEGEIQDDLDSAEDVPENFFDDFNNEGFMESLKIVDSLDDRNDPDDESDKEENFPKEKDNTSRERSVKKRTRKRSRSREERRRRESPHKNRKFDDTALRRDPSKTKRDLDKDRENSFKKKEQKVISKIIETGLVPPGMETEVNLDSIDPESEKKEEKTEVKKPTKAKSKEKKRSHEKTSAIVEERRRNRSRSRSFNKYSPRYRSRSRSRGKRTERSRERRISIRRDRSRSRQRSRFERKSVSPKHNRRRRSPSDRERWLNDRERSPERKYTVSKNKMSFLEEIKMKLNGQIPGIGGDSVTYPFPKNPLQPNFPANTMYPKVPEYNQNYMMNQFPSVPANANYNEDYFIGNSSAVPQMPQIQHQPIPVEQPQAFVDLTASACSASVAPVPAPNDTSEISARVSELLSRISASTNSNLNQRSNQAQGRQWNFTDFLHANPAPEVPLESEKLRKKVDVLSRCQDFLQEITGEKKLSGKLRVIRNQQPQCKREQNVSPLLCQKEIKFSFNTPKQNSYQEILKRALKKSGVATDVVDLLSDDDDNEVNHKKKAAPNLPSTTPTSLKMCQTDPIKCEDCEKRKSVQVRSIGIQCGESERYNVGVQVVGEDIDHFRTSKNQSLAHLTPAQLLGRAEPVSSRVDNFGSWNRPTEYYHEMGRDYYDDPARDYYGRDGNRYPRY